MTVRAVGRARAARVSVGRRAAPLTLVAIAAWVAVVVVQISSARVDDARPLVLTIVVMLAVATWCFAAQATAPLAATAALVVAAAVGFVAEFAGTRTGVPFGTYSYTDQLYPHLADVPLIVPLAWFAMGVPAYAIARAVVPPRHRGVPRWVLLAARYAVGGFTLSAWDLFLDPQMTGLGYWVWPDGGSYFGIPLTNYAGWFAVSVVLMALLDRVLRGYGQASRGLLGLYTSMAIIETIGFLGPLQTRPAIAAIGAVGMGVPAAAAWWRVQHRPDVDG